MRTLNIQPGVLHDLLEDVDLPSLLHRHDHVVRLIDHLRVELLAGGQTPGQKPVAVCGRPKGSASALLQKAFAALAHQHHGYHNRRTGPCPKDKTRAGTCNAPGFDPDPTTIGFRSTFRNWADGQVHITQPAAEMALAHKPHRPWGRSHPPQRHSSTWQQISWKGPGPWPRPGWRDPPSGRSPPHGMSCR